jgi:hypothetical protein
MYSVMAVELMTAATWYVVPTGCRAGGQVEDGSRCVADLDRELTGGVSPQCPCIAAGAGVARHDGVTVTGVGGRRQFDDTLHRHARRVHPFARGDRSALAAVGRNLHSGVRVALQKPSDAKRRSAGEGGVTAVPRRVRRGRCNGGLSETPVNERHVNEHFGGALVGRFVDPDPDRGVPAYSS